MSKKTFFLIPGFGMSVKHKSSRWLVDFLVKKGYRVVGVPVTWKYKTLSFNAEEFKSFYQKNKGKENYVLGFSYGAVIAFITAEALKPNRIYLCSLSAAFKEDHSQMKLWIRKYIGKRRFDDGNTRSGRKIARELSVPVTVFYGDKEGLEYPPLKIRCEETAKYAKRSKLVIIKDGPHQIQFPAYSDAIQKEISRK